MGFYTFSTEFSTIIMLTLFCELRKKLLVLSENLCNKITAIAFLRIYGKIKIYAQKFGVTKGVKV